MKRRLLLAALAVTLTAAGPRGLDDASKVEHSLSRLTWGAGQGDAARVQRIGLERWIDLQLHPDSIPESAELTRRLEPLESLRMGTREMIAKYPPPQVIRAYSSGRLRMPDDPIERARIERLTARSRKQDAEGEDAPKPDQNLLLKVLARDELRSLRGAPVEKRIAWLNSLSPERLEEVAAALPQNMRRGMFPHLPADLRRKLLTATAPVEAVAYDLLEAKIYRAVYSERQLEDVLTDFWFNHFNVFLDKGADRYLVTSYERDAIRPHVLGRFRDLLGATAEHPAMLWYLDNWQSVGPDSPAARVQAGRRARGLNENYGRELLELHTLGVGGGYTQKDVTEVARCFTGWTMQGPYRGDGFRYTDRMHDKGEKVVLGVRIPAGGGKEDGMRVLDLVARHPSTARFISRKLAQRFVADNAPESLVKEMASTFTKSDGDLRAVMKAMLRSKQFWSADVYRAKMKSPLELAVSALRADQAEVDFAFGIAGKVAELGQPLYRKLEPTGYSNTSEEWVNSAGLLARMNFATALARNQLPGVRTEWRQDPRDILPELSPQTAKAIEGAQERAIVAGLILGSPDFQKR